MQNYVIELEIKNCGIEKMTTHLVTASDETEAMQKALLLELHNELGCGAEWDDDDDTSGRIWDFDQEWVYTVYKVTLVESDEDYAVLKKYL